MAQIDFTVTQNQYDTMMVVLDGIRTKLTANKAVLARALSAENGRAKVKALVQSQDPPWLKEVWQFSKELNQYFSDVGLRDDE